MNLKTNKKSMVKLMLHAGHDDDDDDDLLSTAAREVLRCELLNISRSKLPFGESSEKRPRPEGPLSRPCKPGKLLANAMTDHVSWLRSFQVSEPLRLESVLQK